MYEQIAMAAAKYFMEENEKRQQAKQDRQIAQEIIKAISKKMDEVKKELIEKLEALRLQQIRGDLEALFINASEYDVDGSDDSKKLLTFMIDNRSPSVIGATKVIVEEIGLNPDFALKAFPIYACTVSIRAWAMLERKFTFNVNSDNDINRMLETHYNLAQTVLEELRKRNERRFSGIHIRTEGSGPEATDRFLGYTFDGNFEDVAVSHGRPFTDAERQRAKDALAAHKKRQFEETATEINGYLNKLKDVQSKLQIAFTLSSPHSRLFGCTDSLNENTASQDLIEDTNKQEKISQNVANIR